MTIKIIGKMENLLDLFDEIERTAEQEQAQAEPVSAEVEPAAVETEPVPAETEPVPAEASGSGKMFYTIGEVAGMLGEATSLVRFWADSFPKIVKPRRTANKNNRIFRQSDVDALKRIHYLVKECGLTLEGARRRMETDGDAVGNRAAAVERLKAIRATLKDIHDRL